jgi:hypothetical protein
MKKTLLAAAALVVALTGAANALELTESKTHEAALAELSKKYPKIDDVVFFDDDKEVIFYTPEWHMSCKYTVKPKVTIGKCRVIHA